MRYQNDKQNAGWDITLTLFNQLKLTWQIRSRHAVPPRSFVSAPVHYIAQLLTLYHCCYCNIYYISRES